MKSPGEVRLDWEAALLRCADRPLADRGFVRGKRSTAYKRKLTAATHEFHLRGDINPRSGRQADMHIVPMLRLAMPPVSSMALRLSRNDEMVLPAPDVIFNEPLIMTAPPAESAQWYASGVGEMETAIESVLRFFDHWAVPFLEQLETPEGLVSMYERNDARMMKQQHTYVYFAAAYMLLGNAGAAKQVMLDKLNNPGLRARFRSVYEELGLDVSAKG